MHARYGSAPRRGEDRLLLKYNSNEAVNTPPVEKMDLIYFLESLSHHIEISSHGKFIEENPEYRELFASQIEKLNKFYTAL